MGVPARRGALVSPDFSRLIHAQKAIRKIAASAVNTPIHCSGLRRFWRTINARMTETLVIDKRLLRKPF